MKSSTIVGFGLFAGAAVIESALIPGLLIGAAVVLAPKFLPRGRQQIQRKRPQIFAAPFSLSKPAAGTKALSGEAALSLAAPNTTPPPFEVKKAIFKTITFRMVATSFDFAANMVVIGDFTTAVSLSAFGLIGAPIFYFGHEIFWNWFAPAGTKLNVDTLMRRSRPFPLNGGRGLTINRALAKTITYEVVTTTVDFSANYVATRDIAAAAGLTIFAAVVSPFIYYGHEKVWDYFEANESENGTQPIMAAPAKPAAPSLPSIA